MSSAVTGKTGKVLAGSEVTEIRNWSISRPLTVPECSSMSSNGWREYKAGMQGWSGSFETVAYKALVGFEGVGSFYVGAAASASTPIYAGTILVTDAPIEVPYDGIVAYRHTFQGSGSCTVTTT